MIIIYILFPANEDVECLKPRFRCADGSNCIEEKFICDGTANCMDNSDEHCLPSEEQQSIALSDYPKLTGNTGAGVFGLFVGCVSSSQCGTQYNVNIIFLLCVK